MVDLKKYGDAYMKLRRILENTLELIDRYLPDEVAIEAPFYGKNVQSGLWRSGSMDMDSGDGR